MQGCKVGWTSLFVARGIPVWQLGKILLDKTVARWYNSKTKMNFKIIHTGWNKDETESNSGAADGRFFMRVKRHSLARIACGRAACVRWFL